MILIIITFFILNIIFVNIFNKNVLKIRLLTIYLVIWLLVLLLSKLNYYKLFSVSDTTYLLVMVSNLFFIIGTILIIDKRTKFVNKIEFNKIEFNKIELLLKNISLNKWLLTISIVNIAVIFNYYIKYQSVLLIYGAEKARLFRFFVGPVFKTNAEIFFYNYYFETISIFAAIYFSISLIFGKLRLLTILSLVYCYLYSNIGAGRFLLIEIGLYIVIFYMFREYFYKKKILKSLKITIVMIFSSLYLLSIIFVNLRRGINDISLSALISGNEIMFKHSIIYNVGAINALDYGLNNYSVDYSIVRLYFGGLDEVLVNFLNLIGFKFSSANSDLGNMLFREIHISPYESFNAFYTNVFVMYSDMGYLGVCLFSLLNGIIFSYIFNRFLKSGNFFYIFLIAFFSVQMYFTVFDWGYTSPSAWIFSLTCIYIIKKWKVSREG